MDSRSHPRPEDESADQLLVVRARQLISGTTSLHVIGVLDESTAPLLEDRLVDAARNCRVQPARLLLDLDGVTFLNRAGLETLLAAQTRLAEAFVTVDLIGPTPHVVRLLHEANIDGASWRPPTTGRGQVP